MERFRLKRKLGEGGFAKALLCEDRRSRELFVIKEVELGKLPRAEREEARREVGVLARMRHPCIVSYVDSFEQHGKLHIVMDYCDGGDLSQAISKRAGSPFPGACLWRGRGRSLTTLSALRGPATPPSVPTTRSRALSFVGSSVGAAEKRRTPVKSST